MQKHLGMALNIIAAILLIPGILLPMFSLTMDMTATISGNQLTTTLIDKELSLLGTVVELWNDKRTLVATLIFAFSIVIPIVKAILLCLAYIKRHTQLEKKVVNFIGKIGKWSMADVFVVAVSLAILSTNHAQTSEQHQISMFAFKLNLLISSETLSIAKEGFYYFAGYCLVSLAGVHIYQSSLIEKNK